MKKTAELEKKCLDIGFSHLVMGRALLLQTLPQNLQLTKATQHLESAVKNIRDSMFQDELPRALFARAELFRRKKSFAEAWHDLTEAKDISERDGMRLYLANFHLEAARLRFALDKAKAGDRLTPLSSKEHWEEAKKIIEATGYNHRARDLEELREQL